MYIRVEFTNTTLQDFIMDGPRVDYQIHQGFLVVTTNPLTSTPEKGSHSRFVRFMRFLSAITRSDILWNSGGF